MASWFRSASARFALIAFGIFLGISLLSRVLLMVQSIRDVSWNGSLLGSFACGFGFDIAAGAFVLAAATLLGLILPSGFIRKKWGQLSMAGVMVVFTTVMIFITTSEWFFWDEFGVRFNFIAVDYLIWTQEVLGNINESYPMVPIMLAVLAVGAGIVGLLKWKGAFAWAADGDTGWKGRVATALVGLTVAVATFLGVNQSSIPIFTNQYHGELAKNGCWSFFAAYKQMELNYNQWYPKLPHNEALTAAKKLLVTPNEVATTSAVEDFHRSIKGRGPEKKWNVIFICLESHGADFMAYTGSKKNLSPNLDRLANESIFFENLYATGTRTVRGMEALTLNIPPTPGASILYRPEGTNLVTTFTPFLKRGYDCGFFYGGDGRFDYMNRYFSTSGARIMDANAWEKKDTTFKTSWGACDEDLYNKAISEADKDYAAGKPFHFFCMSTSNHRPYDFPEKPGIKPRSGSKAEVRYADWAVGDLIKNASTRPWFKDTLFVICADHCASSAGKAELNVTKFHIPAMIYNPELIGTKKIPALCSQIDLMPTVFGLLNWNYETLSFGHDLLAPNADTLPQRAFISNYQKIGLLQKDSLAILKPKSPTSFYDCDLATGDLTPAKAEDKANLLEEAISYYQSASWLFQSGNLKDPAKKKALRP